MQARILAFSATAAGVALTLLISLSPDIRFGYHAPALDVSLETLKALIALLAAYLMFGRYTQSGKRRELLVFYALGTLALTSVVMSAAEFVIADEPHAGYSTWTPLAVRVHAAVVFAAVPFMSDRQVRNRRHGGRVALTVAAATVGLVAVVVGWLSPDVPVPSSTVLPESAVHPELGGHASMVVAHAIALVAFIVAAVGFVRRAEQDRDELMAWFGAGAILAAFGHLNYLLYPAYHDWVYTGDLLRIGFYLLLLAGCGREIRAYWTRLAEAAVLEERHRIARELHDGLAQELAFIATQTRSLRTDLDAPVLAEVMTAAQRALGESRQAIAFLSRTTDEPLHISLAAAAEAIAPRLGAKLDLDLMPVQAPPDVRHALIRVGCEAITNAARHGRPTVIAVHLWQGDDLVLRVVDDGVGFDAAAQKEVVATGFGLTSMRQRVDALAGTLQIRSSPHHGTEVEVRLPIRGGGHGGGNASTDRGRSLRHPGRSSRSAGGARV